MKRLAVDRICGVETEFGCLVDEDLGSPDGVVEALKDYIFEELRLGVIDLHSRDDVFEPAQCGGFLVNGGRLYVDAVGSHLEYATAECIDLKDLVANDRAGQRLILRAIKELDLADVVSVYNNSVDHFGGHTFGCHENYLVRADDDLLTQRVQALYPFLVSRQIYAGVGRVGGHVLYADTAGPSHSEILSNPIDYIWVGQIYGVQPDDSVQYQLSQRADHILKAIASRVRFNRALINPKWEHLYSHDGTTRLHLLFGESNQSEYAYALKVGTTLLVLRLLEDGRVPEELVLAHPLAALREISRDPTYRWIVPLADGGTIGAVDLQRRYLEAALVYKGSSDQTDWVLREWESTLDALERNPLELSDRLDWVMKLKVLQEYMKSENVSWGDDALHSVDLEYHNIDPDCGLFYGLQEMGDTRRFLSDIEIVEAMTEPPQNTRARRRSKLVSEILSRKGRKLYVVDWNGVAMDQRDYYDLSDPYDAST
jgi:proteasome accessory factor A